MTYVSRTTQHEGYQMKGTSINEVTGQPWADDLPDVPFFLDRVAELANTDEIVGDQRTALIEAIEAALDALRTKSDLKLDAWGEAHDPEWGQS